ncbi:hypothetical protein GJ496_003176, partial [Pomphorhynchus laevis]
SNAVEQQSFKPSNRLDVTIAAVDESLPKVPKKLEDTSQEDNSRNITTGTVVLAKCNAGFFPALIIEKPNSENITVRNFINDSTITVKVNDISILDESKIYQMKMLLPGLDMSKVEEYMRNPHYYSNWTPPCDTEINILSSEDECLQEKDYFLTNLLNFLEASDITFVRSPLVNGVSCDLCVLYRLVNKYGGWSKVCKKHLWGDIHRAMCLPTSGDEECGIELEKIYHKYLRAFYDMNRKLGSPTVASHKGVKRSVPAVTRVSQRLFKPSSSDLRVSVNQKSPLPILQHKTRRNASRSHSPTNKQARIFNITPDNNLQCRHDQWVSLDKIVDIDCSPPAPGTGQFKPKIVRQQSGEASSVSNTDLLSAAKTDETEAYSAAQISRRTHLSSSHSSIECIGNKIDVVQQQQSNAIKTDQLQIQNENQHVETYKYDTNYIGDGYFDEHDDCVQFDHGSDEIVESIREIRINGIQPGDISSLDSSSIEDRLKNNIISCEDEIDDFVNINDIDGFDESLNFQDVQSFESDLPEYLKFSSPELVDALDLQQSISDESSCTTAEIINCLSSNFYDYDSTTTNISPRMSFSPTPSNQNKRNNAAIDLHLALIAIGTGNDNANILLRHELLNTPVINIEDRSGAGSNLAGRSFNVSGDFNAAENIGFLHENQFHLHFSEFTSELASKQEIPFVYSICNRLAKYDVCKGLFRQNSSGWFRRHWPVAKCCCRSGHPSLSSRQHPPGTDRNSRLIIHASMGTPVNPDSNCGFECLTIRPVEMRLDFAYQHAQLHFMEHALSFRRCFRVTCVTDGELKFVSVCERLLSISKASLLNHAIMWSSQLDVRAKMENFIDLFESGK